MLYNKSLCPDFTETLFIDPIGCISLPSFLYSIMVVLTLHALHASSLLGLSSVKML